MNTAPPLPPPGPPGPWHDPGGDHFQSGALRVTLWLGLVTLLALVTAILTQCAPLQKGPFLNPDAPYCKADSDCPENQHCGFPYLDQPARCEDGPSEIDTAPDPAMKSFRDGGRE